METALLIATAFFQLKSAAVVLGTRARPRGRGRDRHRVDAHRQERGPEDDPGTSRRSSSRSSSSSSSSTACTSSPRRGSSPPPREIHDATEILGPDGLIGHALAYALAVIPDRVARRALVETPPRRAGRGRPSRVASLSAGVAAGASRPDPSAASPDDGVRNASRVQLLDLRRRQRVRPVLALDLCEQLRVGRSRCSPRGSRHTDAARRRRRPVYA